MSDHQDSIVVQVFKIMFGLRYTTKEEKDKMGHKALHYMIILLTMVCAQAYKQARWGDIKRLTECIDD
jgi:hypothetical protein